jgi:hypothetical protein
MEARLSSERKAGTRRGTSMSNNTSLNGAQGGFAFPSSEWHMKVEVDVNIDGGQSYHADVFRNNVFMCRVALAGRFANQAAAEEGLDRRLKAWLEDYQRRPRLDGVDGDAQPSPCALSGLSEDNAPWQIYSPSYPTS